MDAKSGILWNTGGNRFLLQTKHFLLLWYNMEANAGLRGARSTRVSLWTQEILGFYPPGDAQHASRIHSSRLKLELLLISKMMKGKG
jgi:hypothetical protein